MVCTAGVALAGSYADWWTGAEPPANPRQVDRVIEENTIGLLTPDGSRKATVARTPNAALVAVATKGGGYCLIPSLAGRPSIGNSCTSAPESELRTYASPPETSGTRVWILYGRVDDDGAASLDLRGVGLAEPVPLERGGFFLLELPQTAWAALDNRHGPAAILDAGGRVLWTGCAWLGPAPGRYGSGNRWGMLGDTPDSCDQTVPPPVVIDTGPRRQARRNHPHAPAGDLSARRPGRHVARADHARETPASSSDSPTCARHRTAGRIQPVRARAAPQPGRRRARSRSRQGWVSPATATPCSSPAASSRGAGSPASSSSPDGRVVQTAFANDAFLAELSDAPRAGKRPGPVPGGPYTAIGYDTHGNQVASTPVPGSG